MWTYFEAKTRHLSMLSLPRSTEPTCVSLVLAHVPPSSRQLSTSSGWRDFQPQVFSEELESKHHSVLPEGLPGDVVTQVHQMAKCSIGKLLLFFFLDMPAARLSSWARIKPVSRQRSELLQRQCQILSPLQRERTPL